MNTKGQYITILFFCSCFVGICRGFDLLGVIPRIVEGEPADIRDFPYQVSVEALHFGIYRHACAASVIAENWAITAASCFLGLEELETYEHSCRLRAGTSFKNSGGEIYEIAETIIHPEFECIIKMRVNTQFINTLERKFNIAVIKVSKPFQYSDVLQPIEMANSKPSAGTTVMVSDWGCKTSKDTPFHEPQKDELQQVQLNIVDIKDCRTEQQELKTKLNITSHQLCARLPEVVESFCDGDIGDPLVTEEHQLLGFSTWYNPKHDEPYIVFANAVSSRDWITSVTGIM